MTFSKKIYLESGFGSCRVMVVVNFVLALFGADFYPVFFTDRIDLPFRSFVTFRLATIKGVILLILRHFLRSHRRSMNSVGWTRKKSPNLRLMNPRPEVNTELQMTTKDERNSKILDCQLRSQLFIMKSKVFHLQPQNSRTIYHEAQKSNLRNESK